VDACVALHARKYYIAVCEVTAQKITSAFIAQGYCEPAVENLAALEAQERIPILDDPVIGPGSGHATYVTFFEMSARAVADDDCGVLVAVGYAACCNLPEPVITPQVTLNLDVGEGAAAVHAHMKSSYEHSARLTDDVQRLVDPCRHALSKDERMRSSPHYDGLHRAGFAYSRVQAVAVVWHHNRHAHALPHDGIHHFGQLGEHPGVTVGERGGQGSVSSLPHNSFMYFSA
jgi:hypothetical protein